MASPIFLCRVLRADGMKRRGGIHEAGRLHVLVLADVRKGISVGAGRERVADKRSVSGAGNKIVPLSFSEEVPDLMAMRNDASEIRFSWEHFAPSAPLNIAPPSCKAISESKPDLMQNNTPPISTTPTTSLTNSASPATSSSHHTPPITHGMATDTPARNPWQQTHSPMALQQWPQPLHIPIHGTAEAMTGHFPGPITTLEGGTPEDVPTIWHALHSEARFDTDDRCHRPFQRRNGSYEICYGTRSSECPPKRPIDLLVRLRVGSDGTAQEATMIYLAKRRGAVTVRFGDAVIHQVAARPPGPPRQYAPRTSTKLSASTASILGSRKERSVSPASAAPGSGPEKRRKPDTSRNTKAPRMDVGFYRPKSDPTSRMEELNKRNAVRIKQACAYDNIFPLRQLDRPGEVAQIFASRTNPLACREGMQVHSITVHLHQYGPLWERISGECRFPVKKKGDPRTADDGTRIQYRKRYTGSVKQRGEVEKFIDEMKRDIQADMLAYFANKTPPSAGRTEVRVVGPDDILPHEAGLLDSFELRATQGSKNKATYLGIYAGMRVPNAEYDIMVRQLGEVKAGGSAVCIESGATGASRYVLVPGDAGNWVPRANTAVSVEGEYDLARLNAHYTAVEITFTMPERRNPANEKRVTEDLIALVGANYDAGDTILVDYGENYKTADLVSFAPDLDAPSIETNTTDRYYHLAPADTGDGGKLPFHHKKQKDNNCGECCVETATHGKFQFKDNAFYDMLQAAGVLPANVQPGDGYGMAELAWALKYHCNVDVRYVGARFYTPKTRMDTLVAALGEVRSRDVRHEAQYEELEQRLRALFAPGGTVPDYLNADRLKASFANAVDELLKPTMTAQPQVYVDGGWVDKIARLKDSLNRVFDDIKSGLMAEQSLLGSLDLEHRDFCILHIRRGESERNIGHYVVWRLADGGGHYRVDSEDGEQAALSVQAFVNYALSQEDNDINGIELIVPNDATDPLLRLMQRQSTTNPALLDYGALQQVYHPDGTGDAGLLRQYVSDNDSSAAQTSSQSENPLSALADLALADAAVPPRRSQTSPFGARVFVSGTHPQTMFTPAVMQNRPQNPVDRQSQGKNSQSRIKRPVDAAEARKRAIWRIDKARSVARLKQGNSANPLSRARTEVAVPEGVKTVTISKLNSSFTLTTDDAALLDVLKEKTMSTIVDGQLVKMRSTTTEYQRAFGNAKVLSYFADYLLRYHGQSLSDFSPSHPSIGEDPRVGNFKLARYVDNEGKERYDYERRRRIEGVLPKFIAMRDSGQLAPSGQPARQTGSGS